jgi:hypothetical protein
VYANASAGATDFTLAKLSPAQYFRGKRVQVLLWDPGEGAQSIQILNPENSPVEVKYRTWNPGLGLADPAGNTAQTADYNAIQDITSASVLVPADSHKVNVGGSVSDTGAIAPPWLTIAPMSPRSGQSLYNGRMLSLEIDVPTTYGCAPPNFSPCQEAPLADDGWWKIRYTTGTDVTDRSTWSVQLLGDPVHLVRDN